MVCILPRQPANANPSPPGLLCSNLSCTATVCALYTVKPPGKTKESRARASSGKLASLPPLMPNHSNSEYNQFPLPSILQFPFISLRPFPTNTLTSSRRSLLQYSYSVQAVPLTVYSLLASSQVLYQQTTSTMQLFLATTALFASLALAQDLSAINNLPACGVSLLYLAPSSNLLSKMANNNM